MLEELLRRASLTVTTAAELLRSLSGNVWIRAVPVVATIPAGATSVTVAHGLGRKMNGAVIVGCGTGRRVSVDLPGTDSDKYVTVRVSAAPGADFPVNLRVF